MIRRFFLLLPAFFIALPAFAQAEKPARVMATVKPLHSLVAAVMRGTREAPELLVDGNSPHAFRLRPSQREALEHAEVVFSIGAGMEPYLPELPEKVVRVSMARQPGIFLLPQRSRAVRHADEHGHEHMHGPLDPHLWLDAANAIAMVDVIADALAGRYPDEAARYRGNAAEVKERIRALDDDLRRRMRPFKDRRFVVFHDAYRYFEHAYGLQDAGALTVTPGTASGARHLAALQAALREGGAECVFYEPPYDAEKVSRLSGGGVRVGVLDAEGVALAPGPELYFTLMDDIGRGLEECLR